MLAGMKATRRLFLVIVLLASSCERSIEPLSETLPVIEEAVAAPPESALVESAVTDEQLESLLSGASETVSESPFGSLSQEQQKTLNAALGKVLGEIELGHLVSTIASQVEQGSIGQATIMSGGSIRTLSPEEVEKLGLNIDQLKLARESSSTKVGSNIEMIVVDGGIEPLAVDELSGEGAESLNAGGVADPEQAKRIGELLESGDSDRLAKELGSMIQEAVDTATLQQALGE